MDDAMRDLLEIAARIARREYLPNVDRCRTISDVRKEVRRYDDYHGHLAMRLKSVWDELKTNDRVGSPRRTGEAENSKGATQ